MHRSPLSSIDGVVHELIVEETLFKVANLAPPSHFVFAIQLAPPIQYSTPLLPTLAS